MIVLADDSIVLKFDHNLTWHQGGICETTPLPGLSWRPFAATAFLRWELAEQVLSAAWKRWARPKGQQITLLAEFRDKGPHAHLPTHRT